MYMVVPLRIRLEQLRSSLESGRLFPGDAAGGEGEEGEGGTGANSPGGGEAWEM